MKKKEIKTGTSEMYQATNRWISELKFIADVELFFEDLILDYTLAFLDKEHIVKCSKNNRLIEKKSKDGSRPPPTCCRFTETDFKNCWTTLKFPMNTKLIETNTLTWAIQTNTLKERNRKLKKELYVVLKKHLKKNKQKKITLLKLLSLNFFKKQLCDFYTCADTHLRKLS